MSIVKTYTLIIGKVCSRLPLSFYTALLLIAAPSTLDTTPVISNSATTLFGFTIMPPDLEILKFSTINFS